MTVSAVVVLLFAVPLAFVFERFVDNRATMQLEHHVDVIARSIDLRSTTDPPELDDLPTGQISYAVYTTDGRRTLGTGPERLEPALRVTVRGATTTIEANGSLITAAPVVAGESVTGIVRGERSLRTVNRDTRRIVAGMGLGGAAVLAIGWLLARRLAATLGDATEQLSDAAQRLGDGDFTIDVPVIGINELDRVAVALNATAQRLGETLTREQTFSADVSHQLRTPLTGLRAALETELAYPRADRNEALHEALGDVARLEQTVTDILALARAERLPATMFDAAIVLRSTYDHWAARYGDANRVLTLDVPDTLLALGTPALLRQALDALLDNALRHGAGSGNLRGDDTSGHLTIAVTDRGTGMPPGDIPGTRLGLALVRRLTEAQGGRFIPAHPGPSPMFRIILRSAHNESAVLPSHPATAPGSVVR